jgi:hypothetical protein
VGTPGFGSTDCAFQNGRPLARINTAKSIYHSLQTRLETRNWKNQLTGGIAWTWSHNIDTVSEVFADATGSISNPQNPFDLNAGERGTSNIDARHTVAINAVWDLPWRRDQKGAVGKILGGWELTGYALIYSPRPWTAFQNFFGGRTDAFRNPFCSSSVRINNSCRPILANPNAPITSAAFFDGGALFDLNTGDPTTFDAVRWIVLDSEAVAAGFPFGSGRNSPGVVGDNTRAINLGIFKNTYVGSENQVNIQFRMIMVNAFNHRNFGPPFDARIDVGGFADPTFNDVIGRKIRFGLRVVF